jgi:hypothetical protein
MEAANSLEHRRGTGGKSSGVTEGTNKSSEMGTGIPRKRQGRILLKAGPTADRGNRQRCNRKIMVTSWLGVSGSRRRDEMQVLCKSTNGNAEMHCSVCGQGFVMFWERQSRSERAEAMREIQTTFRHQHRTQKGPEAHPNGGFMVPEGSSSGSGSGAAIAGHAPSWAL